MGCDDSLRRSVWLPESPQTRFPPLSTPISVEVAVIGGGITGLTTALLLQRSGIATALIEADRVGFGVTGHATAKLTSLHGLVYRQLEESFDPATARVYAEANQHGLDLIRKLSADGAEQGIDCEFTWQPALTYTQEEGKVEELKQEAAAARRAGLSASFTSVVDLPWEVAGAVRVDNQAQFHPYRYCLALAAALEQAGGRLFEETRIEDIQIKGDCCAVYGQGEVVTANHVVVATLLPFLDRGGFFARTHPSRSYALALTLRGEAPRGMYINAESPTRSVRSLHSGRGLIVVGEQHKVGQEPDTRQRYAALESWARSAFPVESIDYCWSSQDYYSVDRLPYVGAMPLGLGRIWTATGFSKWGLTTGTAAAMMLADAIQEKNNPWESTFSTSRLDVLPAAKELLVENANVAKRFVGDRLRTLAAPALDDLPAGQGDLVSDKGERLAAYRDNTGEVHACSTLCTHMGCVVQWNTAEKSWDCPCHGSRFSPRGKILQGPAVAPLQHTLRADERDAAKPEGQP